MPELPDILVYLEALQTRGSSATRLNGFASPARPKSPPLKPR